MSTQREEKNVEEPVKRAFVYQDDNGRVILTELENPAIILHESMILFLEHIPIPQFAALPYPEHYSDTQKALLQYRQTCERFYNDLVKNNTKPNKSFNRGDILPCKSARITDEFVDIWIDSRYCCYRVPKDSVVILTPTHKVKLTKQLKNKMESHIRHATESGGIRYATN